jgi:hypothetical protein
MVYRRNNDMIISLHLPSDLAVVDGFYQPRTNFHEQLDE